jgi:WD40 repeat protein
MAFAPDGRTLAVGLFGGLVEIVDPHTAQIHRRLFGHRRVVQAVCYSPDGKTLASGASDGTVRLWHLETGQQIVVLARRPGAIRALAFSADGMTLAAGGAPAAAGHNVWLWNARK